MFCKICGKEVNEKAVICPHCGSCIGEIEIAYNKATSERKVNILCIIGFVLSLVSLLIALFGIVAIASLVLSIIGVVQTNKNGERLKGLGIAGIIVSAGSLIYTIVVMTLLLGL